MRNRNTFIQVLAPLRGAGFVYLLLLNIVSNMAVLRLGYSIKHIVTILFISFFAAYVENAIIRLLRTHILKIIGYSLLVALHNIFITIDYYLIFQFGRIFNQDIVDILSETNAVEVDNFVETYLSLGTIMLVLLLLGIGNLFLYIIAVALSKLRLIPLWGVGSLIGLLIYLNMGFSYIRFKDGMGLTQDNAIMRSAHSFMVLNKTLQTITDLRKVCGNVKATKIFDDKPSIVIIIGESSSVYHSSLYGYDKNTTPLISERVTSDSLVVFDDIVSVADATHKAMESVFSFNEKGENFSQTPLFPSVFKSVGYYTAMYDNQYFKGKGVTFMSDEALSEQLYDFRNTQKYDFDGEMIKDIKNEHINALYVIHLWGQHYTYSQRYPKEFDKFKPEDYDAHQYSQGKREIIAHYDNATLYNDYVLNEIIKKFEQDNCCIVYLSDHGEEVFELGDFMGHGCASMRKDIRYQIRVPFWIWMSPQYKQEHLDLAHRIYQAKNRPGITDDVSHLLLELSGIKSDFFSASRSLGNVNYDESRPRYVLNSILYEK